MAYERTGSEVKNMTDREKDAAKTIERILASMTPDEKDKILIFVEGMAFQSSINRANEARQLNERTYQHHL